MNHRGIEGGAIALTTISITHKSNRLEFAYGVVGGVCHPNVRAVKGDA
jgi:hypothetical protein